MTQHIIPKYLPEDVLFEYNGRHFKFKTVQDDDMGCPWENSDGHGVVSSPRKDIQEKRPGERLLGGERYHWRFYDVQESTKIAKRDGWGLCDKEKEELLKKMRRQRVNLPGGRYKLEPLPQPWKPLTPGEITAEAVQRDFEFLQGWINDTWHYQCVDVWLMEWSEEGDEWVEVGDPESLCGVEDSDDSYVYEIVYELCDQAIYSAEEREAKAAKEAAERQYWLEREVMTA